MARDLDIRPDPVPVDILAICREEVEVVFRNKPFTFEGRHRGAPGVPYETVKAVAWTNYQLARRKHHPLARPDNGFEIVVVTLFHGDDRRLSVYGSTTRGYEATKKRVQEQLQAAWDDMLARNRAEGAKKPMKRPLAVA